MKTIFIINQYASLPSHGMGGRCFYFARELQKKGYNVYLIAASYHHLLHKKYNVSEDVTINHSYGFNFVLLDMPFYKGAHSLTRIYNWFKFSFKLSKIDEKLNIKPDAVFYSSPAPVGVIGAQRLAERNKAKLIFDVRDIWPLTLIEIGGLKKYNPIVMLLSFIERFAYKNADYVTSNLKNSWLHMVDKGLDEHKFRWIPNGYSETEQSQKQPLCMDVIEKLPKDKFIVGYAGTFGLANDLHTVIYAAKCLKENPDIHFVLVGGGREKEELLRLVEDLDLSNITFVDFVNKEMIQSLLNEFDVLTVGAKNHSMYKYGVSPNKLFDYLIAAKPIIYHIDSGDFNPIKDIGCGFEVPPECPSALAEAIEKIYEMPEKERVKMGHLGHFEASRRYEYKSLTEELEKILI